MRRTAKIGITVSALAVAAVAVAGPGTFAEWSSAASVKETTITTGIQTFTVNGSETPALTIPSATLAAATSDKQTITIDLKGEQQGHRGLYYALPNIAVTAQDAGLVNALQATVYSADPKTTCGATAPKTPLYAGTAAGLAGFSNQAPADRELVAAHEHGPEEDERHGLGALLRHARASRALRRVQQHGDGHGDGRREDAGRQDDDRPGHSP